MTEVRLLLGLEARALFGFNKFRFGRDKKSRRRWKLLAGVGVFLLLLTWSYIGALALGLSVLGMGEIVPAYLAFIASVLIFMLGIFHCGNALFDKRGRDILFSLPVKKSSIVLSRVLLLYLENLALTLAILLPGMAVYAFTEGLGAGAAALAIAGWLLLPLIPTAASVLPGVLVTLAASRLRRKSVWESALMLAFMLGVFALSFALGSGTAMGHEELADMAGLVSAAIGRFYPPALWFMQGGALLKLALWSLLPAAAVALIVCRAFPAVMGRASVSAAGRGYKAGELHAAGPGRALYIRELRRYFSSSVYVTNTIVGPIMALVMSAAILIAGPDVFSDIPVDAGPLIPFIIAGILGMMSPAAVALSMEGRQIHVLRSLPLTRPQLLRAKLLAALSIAAPFYAAAEVLLMMALKPTALEAVWLLLVPAAGAVFSAVFGLAVDTKLGRFDWDSETAMVKQSASAMLGGLGMILPTAVCAVASVLTGAEDTVCAVWCIVLAAAGGVLWLKMQKRETI